MSAGSDALREAARLESARFYGDVLVHTDEPFSVFAARAEAEVAESNRRHKDLAVLIASGATAGELVNSHGYSYVQVRAALRNVEVA